MDINGEFLLNRFSLFVGELWLPEESLSIKFLLNRIGSKEEKDLLTHRLAKPIIFFHKVCVLIMLELLFFSYTYLFMLLKSLLP